MVFHFRVHRVEIRKFIMNINNFEYFYYLKKSRFSSSTVLLLMFEQYYFGVQMSNIFSDFGVFFFFMMHSDS